LSRKQWIIMLIVTFLLECIAYGDNPVIIAYGEPDQVIEVLATAYCACPECCGRWSDGFTATMSKAREGQTIAVDPKIIPLGSKVYIKGMGWYQAEDTGTAMKGKRIDIFFKSHNDAQRFGVKKRIVYIYK